MSDADRRSQALRWVGPAASWALIMFELAALVALGAFASGRLRFGGALALAAAMLFTLAFGLVGVGRESPLLRLVAGAAFMFLALMFFLAFADLATRVRY